ncbi:MULTISPECIES: hypothetical protein [unclassified Mesorhizobium]|uniref:hypothetical protein n=1 Tax=unclassified Mesorhizobium TaxID=325217 RepID=UPI0011267B99|nr:MULTISPECIES: hypothetical protein [unclassified Mesorhizobium]MBZ9739696.1 hypothetical protein [Mesorhizobium sp. CO1-1-4]MBZ9805040.1 hypothetical protein [Mesorhizobium sp. ES1-6]TPL83536.1 hypothetical protein FJ948_26195 [Mesorhizobium sp. B2-3-12]
MNFGEYSGGTVAAAIKHQIGSRAMNRYAESLPCFRVDHNLPDIIKELLERLEHAEESAPDEEPPPAHLTSSTHLDQGRLLLR